MTDSVTVFAVGQRWISSTEPELGLGLVVQAEGRVVQVCFPAADEERAYAARSAPLSRVQFRQGEMIHDNQERRLKVTDTLENNGVIIYLCEDEDGKDVLLPEEQLHAVIRLNSPRERLFAGQIDRLSRYRLRYNTRLHHGVQMQSPVRGLLGPRVQLLPHQIYIAHEVASRHAPRVLLADEVGLGKTIEAGMIVHQQLISGRASRVLVVVPEALLHQWLVEMLRRFNLRFTILDEARCMALEGEASGLQEDDVSADDINPFESAQLVLCGENFLAADTSRAEQARAAGWDILVVDEAHHLAWTPENSSPAYACVERLAEQVPGLLLLTATPEQLGRSGHFARLRLLDPDRYHDLQQFVDQEQQYQQISDVLMALRQDNAWQRLSSEQGLREVLDAYLGADRVAAVVAEVDGADASAQTVALGRLTRDLLDRHGTGRVLFRNTRASVKGFPGRELHAWPLSGSQALPADVALDDQLHPEQVLGLDDDPRLGWLVEFLKQHRQDKVLLICRSAETVCELEQQLRLAGCYSGLFHEGMSLLERDRAAAWFADDEDGVQILLCSEIGSEGRNFQFARHLILFDLPLDPDLLEQRIGRLDRIGQTGIIQIHVPYLEGTAQQRLLNWYADGLGAFESPFQIGQAVINRYGEALLQALQAADEQPLQSLISDAQSFVAQEQARQEQGRDRLLELNSCQPDKADEWVNMVREYERPGVLAPYMEQVFDAFGVEHESHSAEAVIARPGNHMHGQHFPALPEDGLTATFRRDVAMSREDMHFLTWEHPMVTGAMDMILSGDFGNTALCTVKLGGVAPGTLLVESLFVLGVQAPRALQLERYLPAEPVRLLRDNLGRDLSEQLPADQLHMIAERVPKQTAHALVKRAEKVLQSLLDTSEKQAAALQDELIDAAMNQMRAERDDGLQRLLALAEVNPNVRQQEIDQYQAETAQLEERLRAAALQLDAVRIAIAT